ncbi:MAG: hypothetical protein ACRC33_11805 [Gemmataceae bacterium]
MRRLLFGALLCLLVAGCGPGEGKVTGRVLFGGTPLPAGRVTFRPADPAKNSVSVEVDEQGRFETVLPVGDVKVCVDNRDWEPQAPLTLGPVPPGLPGEVKKAIGGGGEPRPAPAEAPKGSKRYVPIPERYYNLETSDLQFAVPAGGVTKDVELKK